MKRQHNKVKKDSALRQRIGELKRNGVVVNLFGLVPMIWSIALVFLISSVVVFVDYLLFQQWFEFRFLYPQHLFL